jgi:hypothetical protein
MIWWPGSGESKSSHSATAFWKSVPRRAAFSTSTHILSSLLGTESSNGSVDSDSGSKCFHALRRLSFDASFQAGEIQYTTSFKVTFLRISGTDNSGDSFSMTATCTCTASSWAPEHLDPLVGSLMWYSVTKTVFLFCHPQCIGLMKMDEMVHCPPTAAPSPLFLNLGRIL